jgi:hypothetical protein
MGTDVLAQKSLGPLKRPARISPEYINDTPTVQLTGALLTKLYGAASAGLAGRLAALDGRPELAAQALRETTFEAAAKQVDALRNYLAKFDSSSMSVKDISQVGPYVVAIFSSKGTFNGSLAGATTRRRAVELPILVVANIRGGRPRSFQTYLDMSEFQRLLGI